MHGIQFKAETDTSHVSQCLHWKTFWSSKFSNAKNFCYKSWAKI